MRLSSGLASSIKKIKVVRVIARLNIGGPAKQALFLTSGLSDSNFESYLISGTVDTAEMSMNPRLFCPSELLFFIPALGRNISLKQDIQAFIEIFKVLRRIKPDIVHTHTAKAGTLGRLAALLAGVPSIVHTFHGHVFEGYYGKVKTAFFIVIEKILAMFTDRIIVLSPGQAHDLIHKFKIAGKEKFFIIPLGFDLNNFAQKTDDLASRKEADWDLKVFALGFIGRLVEIKNPILLIEAFHLLEDYRQNLQGNTKPNERAVTLTIVGGGPLSDRLRSEVQHRGLGKKIELCGWKEDMCPIYSSFNIVVLTSINEGTPVVLIEAMASGKPFVATNVGGVRDLMVGNGKEVVADNQGKFTLYENGILVASGDANGLAGALHYLLEHPEVEKKMGQIGRAFALKRYDQGRLLDDIRSLYQELIASHK